MTGKYYYEKKSRSFFRKNLKIASCLLIALGILTAGYIFFPLISWQIYFQPVYASQNIKTPVPNSLVVNSSIIDLFKQARDSINGTDYTDAKNWFSGLDLPQKGKPRVSSYTISIPKIQIDNAYVSTISNNVGIHLVNYQGTSMPGDLGNAVIFGHSTLPQLFNPKDYKTIFANAYKLKTGDEIYAKINNVTYSYKIFAVNVVDPSDTSAFIQDFDNSYITLVTCTPPGTVWKRLVIKASLERI